MSPLPLSGIRVLEFAGLAPGPLVGMILSDFGAQVIRLDKVNQPFNPDSLCRGKQSLALDPKNPSGKKAIRKIMNQVDVVIDPFRPGVLERLGLGPKDVMEGTDGNGKNQGLVYARLTGFQREGKYKDMAGHDINYIAISGLLSMLGEASSAPAPPSNLLGDFAGGSLVCLLGILFALIERSKSGLGQVVEADMVTGARYVSTFLLLSSYLSHPEWGSVVGDGRDETRGRGMLDGGAPWYGVYKCKEGGWMSVGAIEPQFYSILLSKLKSAIPNPPSPYQHPSTKTQSDRSTWPTLRSYFTFIFSQLPRSEWESIFDGTDACCLPILTRDESALVVLPSSNKEAIQDGDLIVPPPAPRLSRTPGKIPDGAAGSQSGEGVEMLLTPGEHTNDILKGFGFEEKEVLSLWREGAVDGSDRPEGGERSKL